MSRGLQIDSIEEELQMAISELNRHANVIGHPIASLAASAS